MAFNQEWNETTPPGTENPNLGDNRIREFKEAIRERLAEDHAFYSDETGKTDVGHHKQVMLVEQADDSVTAEDELALYCKNLDGQPELYSRPQSAGTPVQLTKAGGKLNEQGGVDIPSNEIILFEKDTAVAGYTLKTDKDDMGVYITKGQAAGGEEGGTDKTGGTWQQPNHTHTGPSHAHTVSSHCHKWYDFKGTAMSADSYNSGGSPIVISYENMTAGRAIVTDVGASEALGEDYWTANGGSGNTGNSGTGATSGNATVNTWRPPGRNFTRQQRN